MGTIVPEGYVITKYEQSLACGFFPGIPGIQQTFTNYEGLDTFTACSGSPYPKEGSEGGFVITENKISTDCVINNNTPRYASVYRSVSSMINETSGYEFEVCTNSRIPDGWGAGYICTQIDSYDDQPCHDGFRDYIGTMRMIKIVNGSFICSNKMRPPKNVVVVGAMDDSIASRYLCGAVHITDNDQYDEGYVGPIKLEFLIPNSEPEIQVCSGWGGYILTSIRRVTEYENCHIGMGLIHDTGCPGGCEGRIYGYIQTYKLPIYTILP